MKTLKSDNKKKLEIKNENIFPKSPFANDEAKEEFNKIKKREKNIDREKLVYDFRIFNTIRNFG